VILISREQPRSSQMYEPTVLPLRPAAPARAAPNNETCVAGCVEWQNEHIAAMPCRSEPLDARRTMPTGRALSHSAM
jgi:hypothetical protein